MAARPCSTRRRRWYFIDNVAFERQLGASHGDSPTTLGTTYWVSDSRRVCMRGHCLCGAIAFEVDGPAQACVVCHCESCRRQCSAPMTTYIGVLDGHWRWLGKPPKVFNSSPGVERTFCDHCGSPLSFRSTNMSGVMHFFAAGMEEPEKFAPTLHVAFEEKLPWLKLADGLPTQVGPNYTKN
ncbi:GFA family protein [Mesorhizobium sp. B2-5-13]|uniref:GFA family protein n=1 Tax=unclassified Mesorhizobium TaxID=325217 RepID=UPI0032B2EE64